MARFVFALTLVVAFIAVATAGATVKRISLTTPVVGGSYASHTVRVVPRARCKIEVVYDTVISNAKGLAPKSTDYRGRNGRLVVLQWRKARGRADAEARAAGAPHGSNPWHAEERRPRDALARAWTDVVSNEIAFARVSSQRAETLRRHGSP
jgi:hypothetical protein